MEAFELDILMNASRLTNRHGSTGGSTSGKGKETEDSVSKYEREIKEDVRALLRAIGNRDQVLSASRRAFQKLDKECKKAVYFTLRKMVEKEKENALLHLEVMTKLEASVLAVDVDGDVSQFIQLNIARDNNPGGPSAPLELSSQALSLLGDMTPATDNYSRSSHGNSAATTPVGSFSSPPSQGNTPSRNNSVSGQQHSSSFHTPTSKLFSMENTHPKQSPANSEELASYLSQIFYMDSERPNSTAKGLLRPAGSDASPEATSTTSNTAAHSELTSLRDALQAATEHDSRRPEEVHEEAPDSENKRLSHEYQLYKRKSLSVLGAVEPRGSFTGVADTPGTQRAKKAHRNTKISHDDLQYATLGADTPTHEWLQSNPDQPAVEAVEWISRAVKSQSGRDVFISELNQFRSKKVPVVFSFSLFTSTFVSII